MDYNCEKTAELREFQGITDVISFFAEGDEASPPIPEPSDDDEHLEDLPRNVLADFVRDLHRDLATAKSQLNTFKNSHQAARKECDRSTGGHSYFGGHISQHRGAALAFNRLHCSLQQKG